MNAFGEWWSRNDERIIWFIIGWLGMACLEAFSRGNWISVFIDGALIALNYSIWKNRYAD